MPRFSCRALCATYVYLMQRSCVCRNQLEGVWVWFSNRQSQGLEAGVPKTISALVQILRLQVFVFLEVISYFSPSGAASIFVCHKALIDH